MASFDYKVSVDKLEGPSDWAKWKWQMGMLFRAHGLQNIVNGESTCPEISDNATAEDRRIQIHWLKEDAKAAGLIAAALNKPTAELVLTCVHAKDIWDKLCARFERSSTQRLNMLIDSFFQAKRDEKEDISTHVAKLQKLFVDLNAELTKHNENTLSERILNGRIMSTLGKEYDNFKDLWDTIPTADQKLNLLIEKLCSIELREVRTDNEVTAFVAKGAGNKKKQTERPKDSFNKIERAKKKFPCNKCKELGHWAAECPQNKMSERRGTSANKNQNKTNVFLTYSFGAATDGCIKPDHWYCDSGASRHITPNKLYFESYTKFTVPELICLGKQNVTMKAHGQGIVRVQMFLNEEWQDAILKNVWYVPDASANLFSVKAAARNNFTITMDDRSVKIQEEQSGKLAASGYLRNELYVMNMRVVKPAQPAQVYLANVTDTLQVYHERFAHQNKRHVKQILKKMDINVAEGDEKFCDGCAVGKMHRLPFKQRVDRPVTVGEMIHADVLGPVETTSMGGARYYVCFKDDYSRFRRLFFLKYKSEVCKSLEQFLNEAKTNGHTVKKLRCDGGKEFDNKDVAEVLAKEGIEHWIVPPYTPQLNGAAERENRTIVEAARSMRLASKLPKALWAEACNTAAYILNRTAPTSVEGKVPYELWYSKDCGKLNHLRIFGTRCYVHIPKEFRKKFDEKAMFGNLVGYVNDKDGYRIWVPKLKRVVCSHDVIFKSEVVCNLKTKIAVVEETNSNQEDENKNPKMIDENTSKEDLEDSTTSGDYKSLDEEEESEDDDQVSGNQKIRTSSRDKKKPNWMTNGEYMMIAEVNQYPRSYAEAMQSKESKQWLAAMKEELASFNENETWKLVDRPAGVKVVKNRWVFREKFSSNGNNPRFKARLVAKGYVQQKGIDYDETFSPVARYDTVRTLLAIAASEKLKVKQFDVKTAFLYGSLEEEVYLEQPEGFEDGTDRVCQLKRSLYGLKQAPRCWHKRFLGFMKKAGLKNSTADPCLFYRNHDGTILYVAIYVDDGLVVGNNEEEVQRFLEKLKTEFKITIGSLNNFLGMKIECQDDGSITVSQENYTKKILERFRMNECNPVTTPATREEGETSEDIKEQVPYREAVGSLMYLATATRPDIAYAVSFAARAVEKPTRKDWNNVKRILRYLRGTNNFSIKYQKDCKQLAVYSDADYAGDVATRRSTTGVVAMFAGGAVSWTSQLQRTVALSTTEAEIIAASEGAKELMWLKRLIRELSGQEELIPVLHVDSASAVKLAKNPEYHKRTKHIEVRHFYVRERFLEGDIKLEHIKGTDQLADLLTKPLERVRFDTLRGKIGVNRN